MKHLEEILSTAELSTREKGRAILRLLSGHGAAAPSRDTYQRAFEFIRGMENPQEKRALLTKLTEALPQDEEFIPIWEDTLDETMKTIGLLDEPVHRKSSLLRIADRLPQSPLFLPLYTRLVRQAIDASDKIEDTFIRRYSLTEIAKRLKERGIHELSLHATKVALGLAEGAGYKKYSLTEIARELPTTCDDEFYRNRTFLGITLGLPLTGRFGELYSRGIDIAIQASLLIEEPYYTKYALFFMAKRLPEGEEFLPLYKRCLQEALNASLKIKDTFARGRALLDILKELPPSEEFSWLFLRTIENLLPLFSIKGRIEDIDVMDVVDFIIVAEEKRMKESRKRRYTRERYAELFSGELKRRLKGLNDIRILELLRPYSHVWVRPVVLRDTVKKVIEHLEQLKSRYHGREIERPLFLKEEYPEFEKEPHTRPRALTESEVVSIDLGATNTVVMRRKDDEPAQFSHLEGISHNYCNIPIVPTLIDPRTLSIGTAVEDGGVNMKELMLHGSEQGKELMEKYLSALLRHIKNELSGGGMFSLFRKSAKVYLTVPVGFEGYRKNLRAILDRIARGFSVELVEEPLAASIGYQIAEKRDKMVMVVDFGGCTLDVMVLRINIDGVHVVAKPDRAKLLGGREIDRWLAEYLLERLDMKGKDPAPLMDTAESMKIALSDRKSVPFVWDGKEVCHVTREEFEKILARHHFYESVDRAISYVLKKAKKIGVTPSMIEAVLLTGGSSQIPSFREKIAYLFPPLQEKNAIYDHSPLTAVAEGALLYGSRHIIDRHLAMAYALKYTIKGDEEKDRSYEIVLEKGEPLPLEKTFYIRPARTLGVQKEVFLEIFEVPDHLVTRRWIREGDMEFIRQGLRKSENMELRGFRIITLPVDEKQRQVAITLCVEKDGTLKLKYRDRVVETPVRLQ